MADETISVGDLVPEVEALKAAVVSLSEKLAAASRAPAEPDRFALAAELEARGWRRPRTRRNGRRECVLLPEFQR